MKSKTDITVLIFGLVVAASTLACRQTPPNPATPTYYPIELGNRANSFDIRKTFFLGHRVERFRLKVRFVNPQRTGGWIPGVSLSVVSNSATQALVALPPEAEPDNSFWTQEFTGNRAEVRIIANSRVDFLGGQPRFEVLAVERHFRSNSARTTVPATNSSELVQTLARGQDIIGFSAGVSEAQHYVMRLGSIPSRVVSLYVSPRAASQNNSTGIRVHLSSTGFVDPDANVAWREPAPGDSGIYTEFPRSTDIFVTVVSTTIGPYLIRNSWLVDWFDDVHIRRDPAMNAAPHIDRAGITACASASVCPSPSCPVQICQNPFVWQIASYVSPDANFDRRIREALTAASAYALDASDGQMRFRSADLYREFDPWFTEDVDFTICDSLTDPACRAHAPGWGPVQMFTADLANAIVGGRTFHHEWGHFHYGLPDEYLDLSGRPPVFFDQANAIDPNTLMGTHASTEFCFPRNHLWSDDAGGEEESAWTQIEEQYQGADGVQTVAFAQPSHARYLDVLRQLEALLEFRIH